MWCVEKECRVVEEKTEKTKSKVKIIVAGTEYTVLTQESDVYTKNLAKEVDASIREMCVNGRISITAAAILTAVNLCDRIKKYEQEAESLGDQIEGYLEAASRQLAKYNDLKRENDKLKKDIETYRKRLVDESPTFKEPSPISESVKPVRKAVTVSEQEEAAEDEIEFFNTLNSGFHGIRNESNS